MENGEDCYWNSYCYHHLNQDKNLNSDRNGFISKHLFFGIKCVLKQEYMKKENFFFLLLYEKVIAPCLRGKKRNEDEKKVLKYYGMKAVRCYVKLKNTHNSWLINEHEKKTK